jgi:uncharacterized protein YgfB (UPF0149 family)
MRTANIQTITQTLPYRWRNKVGSIKPTLGELLKDLNEMAMLAIKNEDTESALESLRKCEEILEVFFFHTN